MLVTRVCLVLALIVTAVNCDFWIDREEFIKNEELKMTGYDSPLTTKESQVNEVLMAIKHAEYDAGIADPSSFLPAQHFFKSRGKIEQSAVFKFIKKFPKGAALHGHTTALSSPEFLFNLTYMDQLYACESGEDYLLHFFNTPDTTCKWELVSDLRSKNSSYNDYLKSKLTLVVDDPNDSYPDINKVWQKFEEIFNTVGGLLTYNQAFIRYLDNVLQDHYDDNVMYVEMRDSLSSLYDLDGYIYDKISIATSYFYVQEQFMKSHPSSMGAKIIYSPYRGVDNPASVEEYIKNAITLKTYFPHFVVGFDLIGQEDLGKPLINFMPQIQELQAEKMNFYFHAGETNWYGADSDRNLIDAVLLDAKRIGHGFALAKHPDVLAYCKEHDIAIEISPISNQVLMLVDDIRNHPATTYIAQGQNVVISNDDPTFWGAKGLSYDWYMAFMGMTSRDADLRVLKQFAINSIQYSGANSTEKANAMYQWTNQLDKFMDEILNKYL